MNKYQQAIENPFKILKKQIDIDQLQLLIQMLQHEHAVITIWNPDNNSLENSMGMALDGRTKVELIEQLKHRVVENQKELDALRQGV